MYRILTSIFYDYINSPNTDYAYLLNGCWGCGKTYFLKNILLNEIKASKQVVYISLNGISDTKTIKKQFIYNYYFQKDASNIDVDFIDEVVELCKGIPKISTALDYFKKIKSMFEQEKWALRRFMWKIPISQ